MAKIKMNVGELVVGNEQTAPRFVVSTDEGKLGELRVSKGGVRWLTKGHKEDAHHVNWAKFDEWMRNQPRK